MNTVIGQINSYKDLSILLFKYIPKKTRFFNEYKEINVSF